jgi:hypothetical protein
MAVMPYRPKKLVDLIGEQKQKPPGAFFPEIKHRNANRSWSVFRRPARKEALEAQFKAVSGLTEEQAIRDLNCELVKLADIRDHERAWAKRGYAALMVELVCAAGYLTVVAIAARGTV